jgi:hypothetical protein
MQPSGQSPGDDTKDLVSDKVAEGVVEALEVVDVDHEDRYGFKRAGTSTPLAAQGLGRRPGD